MPTIALRFEIDSHSGNPTIASNALDVDGHDQLKGLFASFNNSYQTDLFSNFVLRPNFSWWSFFGVVRATADEVTIWAHDESEQNDFVVLTRDQFEEMYTDFLGFVEERKPFKKSYPS